MKVGPSTGGVGSPPRTEPPGPFDFVPAARLPSEFFSHSCHSQRPSCLVAVNVMLAQGFVRRNIRKEGIRISRNSS